MTDPSGPSPTTPGADPGKPDAPRSAADAYELAPHEPEPPHPALGRPPKPGTPQLNAAGLTDDFDEDADFDHDPAMPTTPPKPAPAPTVEPFIKPGFGGPQVIGILGLIAAVAATVLAGVYTKGAVFPAVVLSLYHIGLQTMAGVGAVVFAAWLAEKPLGGSDLAAARMLLAVALARTLLPLDFAVPYVGPLLQGLAIIGAYAAVTWGLFRLPRQHWFVVCACHAILMLVLAAGGRIESWASAAAVPVVKPGAPAQINP